MIEREATVLLGARQELRKVRQCVQGSLKDPPDKRAVAILRAWAADESLSIEDAFFASCLNGRKAWGDP